MRFLILKFISGVNDFNAIQFSKNTLCCTYFLGYGAITTIALMLIMNRPSSFYRFLKSLDVWNISLSSCSRITTNVIATAITIMSEIITGIIIIFNIPAATEMIMSVTINLATSISIPGSSYPYSSYHTELMACCATFNIVFSGVNS